MTAAAAGKRGAALPAALWLCCAQACLASEPLAGGAAADAGRPPASPVFGLVIGNRDYRYLQPLLKTDNDAKLIAKLLSSLDIDTVVRVNLTYAEMISEIVDVGKRARAGGQYGIRPLVIVYFSGHGFTSNGRQYIAGLDANLDADDLRRHSVALDSIVDILTRDGMLVALVDACRSDLALSDEPHDAHNTPNAAPARSSETKGLSAAHATSVAQASDYLVSYANRLGAPVLGYKTIFDLNSPYSDGLNRYLEADNSVQLELDLVRKYLNGLNIQHDAGSDAHMDGDVYVKYSRSFYEQIRNEWARFDNQSSARAVEIFIAKYLNGPFVGQANSWLARHAHEEAR